MLPRVCVALTFPVRLVASCVSLYVQVRIVLWLRMGSDGLETGKDD